MKTNKTIIIAIIAFILLCSSTLAVEYMLNPMNIPVGSSRNISISVISPGDNINVTYPPEFSLVFGTPDTNDSVTFILSSPVNATNGNIYYINISINNSYFDRFTVLAVPDNEIVDNKWEFGHGDFNYPDCQYLPANETDIIFPIIRVWGVGTDILNEEAENVTVTCRYPKIRPRTVDNKMTTDYSNPSYLSAIGIIPFMEGGSLFRIFVLSQEINYPIGNYEVVCDNLQYNFQHHVVNASVSPINISFVDSNPFSIVTSTTTSYVKYTITNTGPYEVRDVEFEWKLASTGQVFTTKKENILSGEGVAYLVWTNGNPNITLDIRQKPCWMFNSRSPLYYDTISTSAFSVNSNLTNIFSVEEAIYNKPTSSATVDLTGLNSVLTNVSTDLEDLLFLFKINTPEYHLTVSRLPDSQQNEANFTCFRLALKSNGITSKPKIQMQTSAQTSNDIIVKNELLLTKVFDFTLDNAGFGIASWESDVGLCSETDVGTDFRCPTIYNYICLKKGVPEQLAIKEEPKKQGFDSIFAYLEGIGKYISPTYPGLGVFVFFILFLLIIYLFYYYDEDLRRWISERKNISQEKKYYKEREEEERKRNGGRSF